MVLIMVPFFTSLFIINNFFLLVDHLLFSRFKKLNIKEPVFIVSMPRTGTTMLLHLLTSLKNEYTTMKLWELIFAPSITQKIIIVNFFKIDFRINSIIKKAVILISDKIFKNLGSLHNTGLEQPEEDELVLLWNLSSPYLQYFYPESNIFDQLLNFDSDLNTKKQNRIMIKYFRHVQRHNYVFNREGNKKFLSKNPFMMSKVRSLYSHFNDAKVLTINRCPNLVINSTVKLSELLFSTFSSVKFKDELKVKIESVIKEWYFHSHEIFNSNENINHLYLDFEKLIKKDETHYKNLFEFLALDAKYISHILNKNNQKYKAKPKKSYQIKKYLEGDDIPFMKKYYKEVI